MIEPAPILLQIEALWAILTWQNLHFGCWGLLMVMTAIGIRWVTIIHIDQAIVDGT